MINPFAKEPMQLGVVVKTSLPFKLPCSLLHSFAGERERFLSVVRHNWHCFAVEGQPAPFPRDHFKQRVPSALPNSPGDLCSDVREEIVPFERRPVPQITNAFDPCACCHGQYQ